MPEPTRLFVAKVRDALTPAARSLPVDATLEEAIEAARTSRGVVTVIADDGTLAGAFSSSDVLDWLARKANATDAIGKLVEPRAVIDADARLFDAVVALSRERVSSLPVTDRRGHLLGFISLGGILAAGATPAFGMAAALSADSSVEGLNRVFRRAPDVVDHLLATGTPPEQILALLSETNAELHRRALAMVVDDLAADGWGSPPVRFALIVMGSGGRGESLIEPDQDNGIIIADHSEAERGTVESYFVQLAERLTATLARIGFELCKGNVMATNPVWRKTLSEWCQQVTIWTDRRHPMHLLNSDVMRDVSHIAGDPDLTHALRAHLVEAMARHPVFVRELYGIEQDHGVALNWLGLLKREVSESEEAGVVNLKMRGTLPLVEGARLLSIPARIDAVSTIGRLNALAAAGLFDEDEAANLADCFRTIIGLILAQQVQDARAARPVTDYVAVEPLSGRDKARLRRALREIEKFRADLPSRLGL